VYYQNGGILKYKCEEEETGNRMKEDGKREGRRQESGRMNE
jgi:hypothetical protein